MSSEPDAIRIWRDTFRLNLKIGFKADIVATVTNLEAWQALLNEWKAKKWNPLNIKFQLSEYERRAKHTNRSHAPVGNQRVSENQVSPTRLPERSDRGMRDMREGTRIQFRRGSETLEEIITKALRANHRP